jgi:hypothetical protein
MLYLNLQSKKIYKVKKGGSRSINSATKAFTDCMNKTKDYNKCEKLLHKLKSRVDKETLQSEGIYNKEMNKFNKESENLLRIQNVLGRSNSNYVTDMEAQALLDEMLAEEARELSTKLPSVPKTSPSNKETIPIICKNCAQCLVDNYDKEQTIRGEKSLVCLPNCKNCAESNREHPMVKSDNFQKALRLMMNEERRPK